jgi:uncharacterized membrane protein
MYCSIVFCVPAILFYLLIAAKIWRKPLGHSSQQDIVNRHLLRSMAVLVLNILICWVLVWAFRSLIMLFTAGPIPIGYILVSATYPLMTLSGYTNGLVLFFCR